MDLLAWKHRVSTLWIFLGVGMLAGMVALMLQPGVLAEFIATGEFEGATLDATLVTLTVILFCLLPLAMAFLTLALRDPINRYANAVLGALAAVMWTWDLAEHASKGLEIGAVIATTLIIAGLLIVWHAWRWPKPVEQDVRDRPPAASPEQRAAGTA